MTLNGTVAARFVTGDVPSIRREVKCVQCNMNSIASFSSFRFHVVGAAQSSSLVCSQDGGHGFGRMAARMRHQ